MERLAKEETIVFHLNSPVSITIYRATRQIPHYHKNAIEILLCLNGSVEVYSMHEKHILQAGDIIEADTFDIHSATACQHEENLMVSFHFDLSHPLFIHQGYDLLFYICSSDAAKEREKPLINKLELLLLSLLIASLSPVSQKETINILSQKILSMLRNHFQYFNHINLEDSYSIEMQERFERIMAYMLKHYAEKMTMHDLCEREHISYNYLSQYFKATSLKTFRNFLHEIRVYHSEHLLLCKPDLSIPDIAFACGFSDPKFFYREFRKKHGHTPHQHRIWYRCYNKKTAPDIRYSLSEQQTTLEHLISKLYSRIICEMVKK